MDSTDDILTLKLKFADECKRIAEAPSNYEELVIKVKSIIFQRAKDPSYVPEFKLQYKDDLNGFITIESERDYQMCISQCRMLSQRTLSLHVKNFDSSAWGSQFKNEGDLKLDAASDGNESLGIELQSSSEEVEPDVKKDNSPDVRKE